MSRWTSIEWEPQDDLLSDDSYGEVRKAAERNAFERMTEVVRLDTNRRLWIALLLVLILGSVPAGVGLFSQLVNPVQSGSFIVNEGLVGLGWGKWKWW